MGVVPNMSQVAGFYTSIDDSLGKAVMIEATKRSQQTERRLSQFPTWTWEDYERFVTWMAWQDDVQEKFFAISESAKRKGAASPASVQMVRGPPLFVMLRKAASASFHVVDHAGGISGLGSMIAEPDEGLRSFKIYNPDILTANLRRKGNFGRINGELDSGKTNTGCVIFEQWLKEDEKHVAIGNIAMLREVPGYFYRAKASTLLRTVSELPDEKVFLYEMDEGGLNYSKPDQTTKHVRQLDKLMRIIRKLHGSFILIEQREESVPNLIVEWARNIYTCHKTKGHGIITIELRGPELGFRDTVKGFPATGLPFNTDDIAPFNFDIDIAKLFDYMAEKPEPKKRILEFLDAEGRSKGEIPRPCAAPGCSNTFLDSDKRRKFCDDHKRYFIDGATRFKDGSRVDAKEHKDTLPASVDDFLGQ